MMLEWLGERHGIGACVDAARAVERAVEASFAGASGTADITRAVLDALARG